jgi:hypothetical protein
MEINRERAHLPPLRHFHTFFIIILGPSLVREQVGCVKIHTRCVFGLVDVIWSLNSTLADCLQPLMLSNAAFQAWLFLLFEIY